MGEVVINPHVLSLKESATLAVNQTARGLRAAGLKVYHFGFGQSPFPVHPKVMQALAANAHQKDYLPTLGLLALREAIARYYKERFNYHFSAENILIGPGSKELIFQVLFVLEGPVLVPAPSWVSYGPQVNIRGKHIVRILTQRENDYKVTPENLEPVAAALTEDQKIMIINSPNNPTGAVYSDREIKALAEVCRRHNVLIISDEIYGPIDFTHQRKKGFHHFYPEGTILTAGLSKTHSAGGYRLGFLACPSNMQRVVKALSAMISETFSAVSAPTQHAAVAAYSLDQELIEYVDDCTLIHKACGEYLHQRFVDMALDCLKPEGAFYLFPSFFPYREKLKIKGISNCVQLADRLLKESGVAVLPGSDFYYPETSLSVRVASVDYDGTQVYQAWKQRSVNEADRVFVESNCPNLKGGCDAIQRFINDL